MCEVPLALCLESWVEILMFDAFHEKQPKEPNQGFETALLSSMKHAESVVPILWPEYKMRGEIFQKKHNLRGESW